MNPADPKDLRSGYLKPLDAIITSDLRRKIRQTTDGRTITLSLKRESVINSEPDDQPPLPDT